MVVPITRKEHRRGELESRVLMRLIYLLHVVPEATRADVLKPIIDQLGEGQHVKLPDGPRRKIVQLWREGNKAAA